LILAAAMQNVSTHGMNDSERRSPGWKKSPHASRSSKRHRRSGNRHLSASTIRNLGSHPDQIDAVIPTQSVTDHQGQWRVARVVDYPFDRSMKARFKLPEDEAKTSQRWLWSDPTRIAVRDKPE